MKKDNLIIDLMIALWRMSVVLVMAGLSLMIAGITVKYGWNNFISQATGLPNISLPLAIGIDLTVTFITGYSNERAIEKQYENLEGIQRTMAIFIIGALKSLLTLGFMYLTTLFI